VLCLSLGPSSTTLIFYFISLILALTNLNLLLFLFFVSCISVSVIYFSTNHTFPGYVLLPDVLISLACSLSNCFLSPLYLYPCFLSVPSSTCICIFINLLFVIPQIYCASPFTVFHRFLLFTALKSDSLSGSLSVCSLTSIPPLGSAQPPIRSVPEYFFFIEVIPMC
jgi:hypothetical protein